VFLRITRAEMDAYIGAASATHVAWFPFEVFDIAARTVLILIFARPAKLRVFTSRLISSTKFESRRHRLVLGRCSQCGILETQILADEHCPVV
jgi:hypothetical protein